MNKKVLFVITSHDELGNTGLKTGFWSEELAAPYYALADKGVNIVLASPKGGQHHREAWQDDADSDFNALLELAGARARADRGLPAKTGRGEGG